MARSAADLALELEVIAGPDEVPQGVGYKLALPPARHQDLPGFRVLVVDTHPLGPTAASIRGALEELADRLSRAGAKVARAHIGQQWRELANASDVVLCPASPTPAFPHDHQRRR